MPIGKATAGAESVVVSLARLCRQSDAAVLVNNLGLYLLKEGKIAPIADTRELARHLYSAGVLSFALPEKTSVSEIENLIDNLCARGWGEQKEVLKPKYLILEIRDMPEVAGETYGGETVEAALLCASIEEHPVMKSEELYHQAQAMETEGKPPDEIAKVLLEALEAARRIDETEIKANMLCDLARIMHRHGVDKMFCVELYREGIATRSRAGN